MADGLAWQPEKPAPLRNVTELFVQGVCRVRNSYLHGEKFVGSGDPGQWKRDTTLIEEAFAVLTLASVNAAPAKKT